VQIRKCLGWGIRCTLQNPLLQYLHIAVTAVATVHIGFVICQYILCLSHAVVVSISNGGESEQDEGGGRDVVVDEYATEMIPRCLSARVRAKMEATLRRNPGKHYITTYARECCSNAN
jgi:hypothetical protein